MPDFPGIRSFLPNSSSQALFVTNTAIGASETLVLEWQWLFPVAAGNEAQGDTVSFTINYMLSSYYPTPVYVPDQPTDIPPTTTVPPTTPTTTPTPTTTETPTPTSTDVPDDATDVVDPTDTTPLPTETTTTPAITPTDEPSANKEMLKQASLGVMISGTFTMTVLAAIERLQRYRRMKLDN